MGMYMGSLYPSGCTLTCVCGLSGYSLMEKINLDVYGEVVYLWGGGWVMDVSIPTYIKPVNGEC